MGQLLRPSGVQTVHMVQGMTGLSLMGALACGAVDWVCEKLLLPHRGGGLLGCISDIFGFLKV